MTGARQNGMPPELSVVILCYRAGRQVAPFVEDVMACLDRELDNWELILVGNYMPCAPDPTPEVVCEIAAKDSRIKAISRKKEGMMGWDVRSGFVAATGKVIALIDGDGQMPGKDIMRAYQVMQRKNCDMVKTYRVARYDGQYRRTISRVYNAVFRLLFRGFEVRDINAKPKLIAREAYGKLKLKSNDWFIDAEIMIQSRRLGFNVVEIPAVFYELKNRRSFVRAPAILEFIKNLVMARLREFFR
jgi:glycosyltransferase involved in cell wall biosynthesis